MEDLDKMTVEEFRKKCKRMGWRQHYVYDQDEKIKEIRTRINKNGKFKYIIQYLVTKNKYRLEYVSEERYYKSS